MRSLAGAVCIVTSLYGGRRYGMTATAVCSATADPPSVLVCVNRAAATHSAIARTGIFCVNVLRVEDAELSNAFSGVQKGEARFRHADWTRLATGAPALVGALVSFDCHVAQSLSHGTHSVFVGEVLGLRLGARGRPLLYAHGRYGKLASLGQGEPLPEGLDYWSE